MGSYPVKSSRFIESVKRCPCRKLNPDILVVQSAQDWHGQNAADGRDGV